MADPGGGGDHRHMAITAYGAQGLCISSGVEEAGCKQIGARLKRAGMRWTVAGANAIIALRCCILSGRFEDFWERRAANAARGSSHKSDVHPPLTPGHPRDNASRSLRG